MSRTIRSVAVLGTLGLLAGCAQQRYEPIVSTAAIPAQQWTFTPMETKYLDTQSPAWNFQHVLEHNVWQCGREADMGYILYSQLRGYGSSKRPEGNAQALADCQQYAYQRGNEAITRLKQAKVSTKTLELSKDLYSKWSVYMAGMTISAPKDAMAATQYETSRRAVLTEDKFSQ